MAVSEGKREGVNPTQEAPAELIICLSDRWEVGGAAGWG